VEYPSICGMVEAAHRHLVKMVRPPPTPPEGPQAAVDGDEDGDCGRAQ
jgi:hypothetical protein